MRKRTCLALIGAILLATGPAGLASRSEVPGYEGTFRWTSSAPGFGGFSAIEVSPDGSGFVALTDRGMLVDGEIERGPDRRITGVRSGAPEMLAQPEQPAEEGFRFDTEGLALAGDGGLYVSTEFVNRVLHYPSPADAPDILPVPRDFVGLGQNGGLEALAIGPDGALYTLPEVTLRPDGGIPVFRFHGGAWDQPFRFHGDPAFLPVAADVGPDGRLYVLERQFRGLGGFASRLVRMTGDGTGEVAAETVFETAAGAFGNLEGLSVWREPDGGLRATLISDNNFLDVLGTEIVEFRLPD